MIDTPSSSSQELAEPASETESVTQAGETESQTPESEADAESPDSGDETVAEESSSDAVDDRKSSENEAQSIAGTEQVGETVHDRIDADPADVVAEETNKTDEETEAGAEDADERTDDPSELELDAQPEIDVPLVETATDSQAESSDSEDDAVDSETGEDQDGESAAEGESEIEADSKDWYVVKVQSGREESIKAAIERRVKIEGLEQYFDQILIPVDKEVVKVKGQRKVRERKRYPGYIMAKVDYNDEILYLFRETSGVGDFVGGGINHPPQPMSYDEVRRMTHGVDGGKPEKEPKHGDAAEPSPYSIGDHVRIKDGVFAGMEAEVKEVLEAKGQVRAETQVLGREVSVELEYWQVEGI